MDITLEKTKTLVPCYRVGTALQVDAQWYIIDTLRPDSTGNGWVWTAICHECTEAEADVANAPRQADLIQREQAVLLALIDGLTDDDQARARLEIDATTQCIDDDDLAGAEQHEHQASLIIRGNLQYLSED